ncbi:hypothetical protein INP81_04415 [Comamonas thiooxydans]|uniref:hypothetical protein n=1 Tax=Comamonas thiooxydans TaxID=363952 RepID=UPI0018A3DF6E|nr:hypothetical protein [Comamonas thiooxydans]QOQ83159.1 hypothetical protein INP81_04415 [Comamonas thiooxydans]
MTETLNAFDEDRDDDHPRYLQLNSTGQAFGFALAYAISNRHLLKQANGVQELKDELYNAFTEHLPEPLSPDSITVLHGIVEGMEKAILAVDA